MDGIELVTDRNSLRKIYGLFTPDAMYGRKPFRIDAQLVGDTVLFTRWENPAQLVRETRPMCFSKLHELATVKQQMADVSSCHRIVRYTFGGINVMVRFELDAVTSVQSDMPALPHALPETWEQVGDFKVYRTDCSSPPLSTFIEKKTRSMHGNLDYIDIYGQMVFSQTPNLYVARHKSGHFEKLEMLALGQGRMKGVAEAAEEVLAKVAAMLREMVSVVKEHKEVSFVWSGQGERVDVWQCDGLLPVSLGSRPDKS